MNYHNETELMKERQSWMEEYMSLLICRFHSRLYLEHQKKGEKTCICDQISVCLHTTGYHVEKFS